ncbi:MAG: carboxypeptidase-like regulatory domain-containing protein, partial [Bacteroidota bacterium]
MRALARRLLTAALFVLLAVPAWAQTGKISGRVTDAQTGDALPGVNVIIEGTTQGAGTDLDGYYTILNVRPGTYTLDASFIGYAPQRIEGVRVSVDQTATVNIQLREEAFEGEEIVVTAERPVVQPDVSNSQLVISGEKVEALPVAEVTSAIGLQAGVQVGTNGPVVRGGDPRDLLFNVNGLTLRDQRTNNPFINVPLSAVGDISVQTGGFNAEYGNARSGVVNVTTKLGSRDRYEATVTTRYSPPQQKHFGDRADNPDTYWLRPYLDPDVAFTGTRNGAWDEYTQAQFPEFAGWNALSAERLRNDDPTDDLSPFALQQAFLFQHRKQMEITDPDYTIDAGVGGPLLPGGRARFYASFRQDQEMYLVPLSEDAFRSSVGHMKVTTELTTGMRLSVEGLLGNTTGTTSRRDGGAGIFRSPASIASQLDRVSFIDTRIYASDYWNPTEIESNMVGATFTHTLDQNTFYEAKITRFGTDYNTFLNPLRDSTAVVTIGGVGFDEAPFGFQPRPTFGVEGMRTGVGMSNARDTSNVIDWNFKLDVTRQFNRFLQGKAGVEYTVTDFDVSYGRFDEFLPSSNAFTAYDVTRQSLGGYAQTKLEFQGLIANLGLRLEYFRSRDDFSVFEPFTQAFSAQFAAGLDTLLTRESVDGELTLSPRLGVSFPITTSSKLYFNYGHFRNLLQPDNLYPFEIFSSTGQINFVPNP